MGSRGRGGEQDLVLERPGLPCGNHPDGRLAPDRALVFADATADTPFKVHIRNITQHRDVIGAGYNLFFQINRLGRSGAKLLAHNAGPIAGPRETPPPVHIGNADYYGTFNLFLGRDLFDGTRRANAAAQGAGIFAVALGHNEVRRPEPCHAGLCKGRVDSICGTGLHAKSAPLAQLKEVLFG